MKMGEIRLDYCCRLCLKEGFSLANIFSHRSAAGDPLYRILNFIYEMKIFENDGLPSQICSPCMWRMIEFDACKRNVRSAEAEIMRLLNETRPRPDEAQNNSLVMKTEVTEMDRVSEVGTECNTVHPECLEEAYNNSLSTREEVTEMDGASELGIYCDTVHSEINIKEEIEIVEWQMPEEMKRGAMEGQGDRNLMNIDHGLCSSKVILQGKELKESELFMDKVDAIQPTGSSDSKISLSLEASEENVRNSLEGESIFSTQDNSFVIRDANKGMTEEVSREEVVPEEESTSAELSESILSDTESELSHLKPPLSERKSVFVCDICEKSFTRKYDMGNHVRVHYVDRPFSCSVCKRTFKQVSVRYHHELTHLRDNTSSGNSKKGSKKNQYNCGICAKNFRTKGVLDRHLNLHNNKYKCNSCGKCFQSNADLRRHLRIHKKEKPFKCKVCQKCFIDNGNLNSHFRIHSSEKPFSCEICDKKFKRNSHKVRHELQHLRKNILNC